MINNSDESIKDKPAINGRIGDIPKIKSKRLTVKLTKNCNLQCPWCADDFKIKNDGPWSDDVFEKFKKYIFETPYETFFLSGGEPLLYKDQFKKVIQYIRSLYKEANIQCLTNGLLLDEEYVKLLNVFKIYCVISVQFDGYKSLDSALAKNNKFIEYINLLKEPQFRIVLVRPVLPFYEKLVKMNNLLNNKKIVLSLDFGDLQNYTLDDIKIIKNDLQKFNSEHKDNPIHLNCSNTTFHCDCLEATKTFFADGFIGWHAKRKIQQLEKGCTIYKNTMKPEVYEAFIKQ